MVLDAHLAILKLEKSHELKQTTFTLLLLSLVALYLDIRARFDKFVRLLVEHFYDVKLLG